MQLVWFRNDLRLVDNPALSAACAAGEPVKALVCLTPVQWAEHNESDARIGYWQARLQWLEKALAEGGIELIRLPLQRFSDCPEAILDLARKQGTTALHFNYEYPLNECNRDRAVCELLEAAGVKARGYHGDLIIPPGQVVTGQGTPFKVFTPFSKAWMRHLLQIAHEPLPSPLAARAHAGLDEACVESVACKAASGNASEESSIHGRSLPAGDPCHAVDDENLHAHLQRFIHEQEPDYQRLRDFPSRNATSGLSAALTIGALSARQCLAALKQAHEDESWQQSTWLNELIWREFYRHLLVSFPELNRMKPFRPEVEARITWLDNDQAFEAWKAGETGFPIVDAAMKQLLATGWMHNRLRMIVASFLTKLLRVDWRRGEAFFMSQLIDGDFASNLGGWQWSASVGADAAPYFRIFNPQLQSEKFDPNGAFIAEWLPELRHLEPKARHKPGAGQQYGRPAPIIDYKKARQAALDDYNG
ncbi:deoxyribodipyrimidine photo-lyase [Marinobacterium maritimum]|uniref:Deoxyribodipyrimidine photo-lyase n=1 Tax=Marinobacterium maritimum TaxID=500162 RepID=A0ABN1I6P6_9GAMM